VSPTLVLLHSPLTTAAAWGDLPGSLRSRGWDVAAPDIGADVEPPYAGRYVAAAAQVLLGAVGSAPTVLVGHSGAGPLLPQVGFARLAAQAPVAGYLFLDAMLPRAPLTTTRLDVMRLEDEAAAESLARHLEAGGVFPDWTEDTLSEQIADPTARKRVLAALRPRRLDFFSEPLPLPEDWPDAPTAYLQLSAAYGRPAATARLRGWQVRTTRAHHFAAVTDPELVADEMDAVLRGMLGGGPRSAQRCQE
jgi:hypothetical protein